ncbi:MAG: GH25 family lysozyme [Anaerolineales bacterium]
MTNALGLDLSRYDEQVDFSALASVIDFVTLKCGGSETGSLYSDPRFAERIQQAYDHGIACGAYWFVGPGYWLGRQQTMTGVENLSDDQHPMLVYLRDLLKNKAVYWLAFDVEDASLRTSAGQVTDTWLAFYIRDLVERIQRQQRLGNMRPFKLGVYSRRSFTQSQPALETYLGTQPDLFIWTANWANTGGGTLSRDTQPPTGFKPIPFGWSAKRAQEWTFWQWAGDSGGRYIHPAVKTGTGALRPLDVNVYNGEKSALYKWAGIEQVTPQPTPEPTPQPQPEVDLTEVNAKLDAVLAHLEKLKWLERES